MVADFGSIKLPDQDTVTLEEHVGLCPDILSHFSFVEAIDCSQA